MAEKHIGDQKEKFLVARMTERQKKIAQFKAHKIGEELDEMVLQAVDLFDVHQHMKDEPLCPDCQKKVTVKKQPVLFEYEEELIIQVQNYPKRICGCQKNKQDMYAENYLEDIISFEIQQAIKEDQTIPQEMDLDDLLNMQERGR